MSEGVWKITEAIVAPDVTFDGRSVDLIPIDANRLIHTWDKGTATGAGGVITDNSFVRAAITNEWFFDVGNRLAVPTAKGGPLGGASNLGVTRKIAVNETNLPFAGHSRFLVAYATSNNPDLSIGVFTYATSYDLAWEQKKDTTILTAGNVGVASRALCRAFPLPLGSQRGIVISDWLEGSGTPATPKVHEVNYYTLGDLTVTGTTWPVYDALGYYRVLFSHQWRADLQYGHAVVVGTEHQANGTFIRNFIQVFESEQTPIVPPPDITFALNWSAPLTSPVLGEPKQVASSHPTNPRFLVSDGTTWAYFDYDLPTRTLTLAGTYTTGSGGGTGSNDGDGRWALLPGEQVAAHRYQRPGGPSWGRYLRGVGDAWNHDGASVHPVAPTSPAAGPAWLRDTIIVAPTYAGRLTLLSLGPPKAMYSGRAVVSP